MPYLRPGTPTFFPQDAGTFLKATEWAGMPWLKPLAWKFPATMVNMEEMSNGPPPPNQTIGDAVVSDALLPAGPWDTNINTLLDGLVKSYLYATYITAEPGDPPAEAPTPPDPPPEPPGGIPVDPPLDPYDWRYDSLHWIRLAIQDLIKRVNWHASVQPATEYNMHFSFELTGIGQVTLPPLFRADDEYPTWAQGVQVDVVAHPDYEAADPEGEFMLHYGLGDVALGDDVYSQHPFKLMHLHQLVMSPFPHATHLQYNLREGVAITVVGIYPKQFSDTLHE